MFADLAPFKLIGKTNEELLAIIETAREIIFTSNDTAAMKHAGLILHYAREYQK